MASYLLLFSLYFGMTLIIPGISDQRRDWLGLRFNMAGLVILALLYLGNVLVRAPLTFVGWGILIICFSSLLVFGVRSLLFRSHRLNDSLVFLTHPVYIFGAISLIIVGTIDKIDYFPYLGDELASWLKISRQIFLSNDYWSAKTEYHLGAYPNGWPLLIVFPNLFFESFNESRSVPIQFLMHIGVIGLTYDILKWIGVKRGGLNSFQSALWSWIGILTILCLEASWKLWPTDLLVDRPIFYIFLTIFLLGMVGISPGVNRNRITIFMGFAFGVGYLIKASILPAGGILLAYAGYIVLSNPERAGSMAGQLRNIFSFRVLFILLALCLPIMFALFTWNIRKQGVVCQVSISTYLAGDFSLLLGSQGFDVGMRMYKALGEYITLFKFQLSLASILVIIVTIRSRMTQYFLIVLIFFFATYLLGLYVSYIYCMDALTRTDLESFQRFIRLPIRIFHYFGILLLFCWLVDLPTRLVGAKRYLNGILGANRVRLFAVLLAILGCLYQLYEVNDAVTQISARNNENKELIMRLRSTKRQSEQIKQLLIERNINLPAKISLIDQSGSSVTYKSGIYFSIKSQRNGSFFHYRISAPYHYSGAPNWTESALIDHWRNHYIVWPVVADAWIRSVLAKLVKNIECKENPEEYIFVNNGGKFFSCIKKL